MVFAKSAGGLIIKQTIKLFLKISFVCYKLIFMQIKKILKKLFLSSVFYMKYYDVIFPYICWKRKYIYE